MLKKILIKIGSLLTRFLPSEYVQNNILNNWKKYWTRWNPDELFPETYKLYGHFMKNRFFPLLDESSCLLDLGCAEGADSLEAALRCKHVYAIDISPAFLEKAIEKAKNDKIANVEFLERNLLEWMDRPDGIPRIEERLQGKIEDGEWDLKYIILGWFFLYFAEDESVLKMLKLCYRILPEDGFVAAKESLAKSGQKRHIFSSANGYMAVYRTSDEYKSLIDQAGFEITEYEKASFEDNNDHYIFLLKKKPISN